MRQLLIILTLSFVSCRQGIDFVVHNDSPTTIDSIRIKTTDSISTCVLSDISPGQTKTAFLNMSELDGGDGHYILNSFSNNLVKTIDFGYYTNGIALEDTIDIFFVKDTLSFKFSLH